MVFVRNNYSIGQHFAMCCLLLCLSVNTYADEDPEETKPVAENAAKPEKKAKKEQSPDDKPMLDRWAFKTNAVEWMLTIPNFEFEFELSPSPYNRWALNLEAKYNWETYHKNVPSVVFNLFDIRPGFRYYFRQKPRVIPERPRMPENASVQDSVDFIRNSARFCRDSARAERPIKPWRAYFLGGYVDYASYSAKFAPKGIQGNAVGFGAVAGYALPLRAYKNGAVNIEFALSAGFAIASKDVFSHSSDGNYYVRHVDESRGWHFVPYPTVTEIKVAFVWRHISIKDKYIKEDPKIEKLARVEKDIRAGFDNEVKIFKDNAGGSNKERYDAGPQSMLDEFGVVVDNEYQRVLTVVIPNYGLEEADAKVMEKKADAIRKQYLKDFEKEWKKRYAGVLMEAAAAEKTEKKALKQAEKSEAAEKKAQEKALKAASGGDAADAQKDEDAGTETVKVKKVKKTDKNQ